MADETNDRFAHFFVDTGKAEPPRHLGTRYDAQGHFLPQPGNTIVCHVAEGSRTAAALVAARDALAALPHGDSFAYTPPSSYHMTVFQGTLEGRRQPGYWPDFLPPDATIAETTTALTARLEGLPPAPAFRMRPVELTPLGVVVAGAGDADEASLRSWRDTLAGRFGYRHPDHATYVFHLTLAYQKAWLPEPATGTYVQALERLTGDLRAAIGTLDLEPPAFCAFDDMTRFRPVLRLG